MKSDDLTLRLYARIEQYTRDNPIRIKTLAMEFQKTERTVKDHIRRMRLNGLKVGHDKSSEGGVFVARTPEEIYETVREFRDDGRDSFFVANKLADWGNAEPTIFEQIENQINA
jgi:hypothetical protein